MSKEEKAKEYAKVACLDIVRHYNVFTKEEISEFTTTDYLAGYTQAEQDLSTQLTAYKEALRETLINYTREIRDYMHESHNLIAFDEREDSEFVDIFLTKAKTLIE